MVTLQLLAQPTLDHVAAHKHPEQILDDAPDGVHAIRETRAPVAEVAKNVERAGTGMAWDGAEFKATRRDSSAPAPGDHVDGRMDLTVCQGRERQERFSVQSGVRKQWQSALQHIGDT